MPNKSKPILYKIPSESGGNPEPGKISEMFLEFSEPLLQLDPDGPPDIEAIRNMMIIATVCWNLPVAIARKEANSSSLQKMFDRIMAQMPSPIADILLRLIEDRKTKFAAVPFSVLVRVEGTNLKDARIIAEARMPA